MRKGFLLGFNLKSGEFNGKNYSFYQAFFKVDALPDTVGLNIITCRCDDKFPELCENNINKEFELFDYFNNNRLQLAGMRLVK